MVDRDAQPVANQRVIGLGVAHRPFQPFGPGHPGREEATPTVEQVHQHAAAQKRGQGAQGLDMQSADIQRARIDHKQQQRQQPTRQARHVVGREVTLTHGVEIEGVKHHPGQRIEDVRRGKPRAEQAQQPAAEAPLAVLAPAEDQAEDHEQQ